MIHWFTCCKWKDTRSNNGDKKNKSPAQKLLGQAKDLLTGHKDSDFDDELDGLSSGWFPQSFTTMPTPEELKAMQSSLCRDGSDPKEVV